MDPNILTDITEPDQDPKHHNINVKPQNSCPRWKLFNLRDDVIQGSGGFQDSLASNIGCPVMLILSS